MSLRGPRGRGPQGLGLVVLLLLTTLSGCNHAHPSVIKGEIDLSSWNWDNGPVALTGEWHFNSTLRTVPDTWHDRDGGGPDGRGSGTYRVHILVPETSPALALRWGTASTAMLLKADGQQVAAVGKADSDLSQAVAAYRPGWVQLPGGRELELEIFVANPDYRTGGLWEAPLLGPAAEIEAQQWLDQASAMVLFSALAVIGLASLLLYWLRRSEATFLSLGAFSLLVALRALVTGEYDLMRLWPGLPFHLLIRLEYLTAFLPLPVALRFFSDFFPGLARRSTLLWLTVPSLVFAVFALVLPLDLLTRTLPFFYPVVLPTIVVGAVLLARRVRRQRKGSLLLFGALLLTLSGVADIVAAAAFTATTKFLPWGLALFVVLQATTLARRFLEAFQATEHLLAEKDLLVKEVHHRVKNSLQLVASLISLQARRSSDPIQKSIYKALQNRVNAIGLVHEKLYGRGMSGRPDVVGYLRDLLRLQYPGDGLALGTLTSTLRSGPVPVEIDFCINAGLIVTELVGNAHKHGVLPKDGGKITVEVGVVGDRLILEVKDDGPGFPNDFVLDEQAGMGFRLVSALLPPHQGVMTLGEGPGGKVHVELRLPGRVPATPSVGSKPAGVHPPASTETRRA